MGFITFITMLTLVFVILKCLGRIAWSWVWVLCPHLDLGAAGGSVFSGSTGRRTDPNGQVVTKKKGQENQRSPALLLW